MVDAALAYDLDGSQRVLLKDGYVAYNYKTGSRELARQFVFDTEFDCDQFTSLLRWHASLSFACWLSCSLVGFPAFSISLSPFCLHHLTSTTSSSSRSSSCCTHSFVHHLVVRLLTRTDPFLTPHC